MPGPAAGFAKDLQEFLVRLCRQDGTGADARAAPAGWRGCGALCSAFARGGEPRAVPRPALAGSAVLVTGAAGA